SSTAPPVADSFTTELASPESLVVFADADLGKGRTETRESNARGAIATEASVSLMPPKSQRETATDMPNDSHLDPPVDLDLPALSGGTPANTVSSMLATGPGQIAA